MNDHPFAVRPARTVLEALDVLTRIEALKTCGLLRALRGLTRWGRELQCLRTRWRNTAPHIKHAARMAIRLGVDQ